MAKSNDLARIIIGCQRGDDQCFAQLVDTYSGRLYGYFYRLTGNKDISDELLSELYVKLVDKIGLYKGGTFEGWLFRIASNLFHDYLRNKQRQKKLIDTQRDRIVPEVCEDKRSEDDRVDLLQKQLARLDADTKELIMLRFYSQLSFKEMAQIRSEPIGTTLAKMHRGLKKLRGLMEG